MKRNLVSAATLVAILTILAGCQAATSNNSSTPAPTATDPTVASLTGSWVRTYSYPSTLGTSGVTDVAVKTTYDTDGSYLEGGSSRPPLGR